MVMAFAITFHFRVAIRRATVFVVVHRKSLLKYFGAVLAACLLSYYAVIHLTVKKSYYIKKSADRIQSALHLSYCEILLCDNSSARAIADEISDLKFSAPIDL